MSGRLVAALGRAYRRMAFDLVRRQSPVAEFHSDHYLRHNARRLEHLASLRIPVAGKSVLEVGSGIGDHSHYYIDRGCDVLITEARVESLHYLRRRYPTTRVQMLDLEHPTALQGGPFGWIHCYGVLYHLANPQGALEFLSRNASGVLVLETCVSFGVTKKLIPSLRIFGTRRRPSPVTVAVRPDPGFSSSYVDCLSMFTFLKRSRITRSFP